MSLRYRAGDMVYSGSFISHWLETLLYYRAPAWVFAVAYTLFGALVVASWYFVRPRPFGELCKMVAPKAYEPSSSQGQ